MSKIGFAAIGTGARMCGQLELLLQRHGEEVELRAVADDAAPALEAARRKFGTGVAAFADYRRAIETPGVQWVLIGSMNCLHRDHCVAAFEAGKHVFCEKPLAITIAQCADIMAAYRKAGTLFAMGFVLRHAPLYVRVHELVAGGTVGKVISFEANETLHPGHGGYIMCNWRRFRRFSGPHILEKCCHDVDLLNWMVNSVPSRVASFAGQDIFRPENKVLADRATRPDDPRPYFKFWSPWEDVDPFLSEKDIEDNSVSILEYRNGVRGTFHASTFAARGQRRMYLCGLEGALEADLATGAIVWRRTGFHEQTHEDGSGQKGGHGGADGFIMDDLAHGMVTGEPPKAGGEDGLRSAVACLAIDEAYRTGRVVDLEPYWKKFGI